MKMRRGGASGAADVSDHISAAYRLTGPNLEAGKMSVPCRDSIAMVEDDQVSVVAFASGNQNLSIRWG
jgi:hypothetical protein